MFKLVFFQHFVQLQSWARKFWDNMSNDRTYSQEDQSSVLFPSSFNLLFLSDLSAALSRRLEWKKYSKYSTILMKNQNYLAQVRDLLYEEKKVQCL